MTAKELIIELQKFEENTDVVCYRDIGDRFVIETINAVESSKYVKSQKEIVLLQIM